MKTECTTECLEANGKRYACTVSLAMDLIGGKWKAVVLYHLQDGAKRFGELHAHLVFATEAVLSRQLKELERDGLVSLTELGRTAIPVLQAVTAWGNALALDGGCFQAD